MVAAFPSGGGALCATHPAAGGKKLAMNVNYSKSVELGAIKARGSVNAKQNEKPRV